MRRLTTDQVQAIITEFKDIGDLSFWEDDPETIQEGYEEGLNLLTNLDLDKIGYHHVDILVENYGLEIGDHLVLDVIAKYCGFTLDFYDFDEEN